MECRVAGDLDACRIAHGPGMPWSWDKPNCRSFIVEFLTSLVFGLHHPLLVLDLGSLVLCGWGCSYECVRGSLRGLGLPQEGTDALSSSWRGEAGAGAWVGPGLGIGEDGAWRVAGGAAGRHFDLGVEYSTACFQLPQFLLEFEASPLGGHATAPPGDALSGTPRRDRMLP